MSKQSSAQDVQGLGEALKSFDSDAAGYKRLFERLGKIFPSTHILIITTLPRGSTQIVQPANVSETILRDYARDMYRYDRATWQTILKNKPLKASDVWSENEFAKDPYRKELLDPSGLRFLAVAPLSAPVFASYPGAIHVYRTEAQGDFTQSELKTLGQIAKQVDAAIIASRDRRRRGTPLSVDASSKATVRQYIFDKNIRPVPPGASEPADQRLSQQIRKHVAYRLEHLDTEPMTADRVQFPDSAGGLWTFRAVAYKGYPALGNGSFVFMCLQPEPFEWDTIKPTDFQADPEVVRLIPTLKFMRDEFHRNPGLDEIAAKAHLSPFHFHRRFSDLLGQTPKNFLLGCQINHAKKLLLERKVALADIASACGFAHQSHFTSRFKQATGLTPTRWRRLAIERVQSGKGK